MGAQLPDNSIKSQITLEQGFRHVLDAISDMVLVKGEKSRILWANKAFCEFYGMSREQLIGMIDAPFNEPDYTKQYIKDDAYVFETGRTLNIPEENITRHDGYVGVFHTVKSAIVDWNGKTTMTVGISREITSLKEANRKREVAEAEVIQRVEELKQVNKNLITANNALDARGRELELANEKLNQLDVLKTQFFSNISHEFRTPLTLMLGPLEDALSDQVHPLAHEQRIRHQLVLHSTLRLLKLVNSLLDFSRIEAGRMQAIYEPTDLAKITQELASHFESAMKKAKLKYTVTTHPVGEPVFVDHEMWEKIVLNLLSNAFKFTLKGEVSLNLRAVNKHVELTVQDTGVGIAEKEIPNIFKRFYRIEGSRGRTFEGTGIGLSLVQELVKMHGGSISVTSKVDQGSTFNVNIPLGISHLPANQIGGKRNETRTTSRAEEFVEEALQWLPIETTTGSIISEIPKESSSIASRILFADDNADMRAYVESLLKPYWRVTLACDGQAAYEEIVRGRYDLVLSDVMMPRLDGFGLVKKLRENPATKMIPILLLSARAGEESKVAGVRSGADDYLIKPFSAKELVARIKTHLELKRLRDERFKLSEARLKTALTLAQLGAWDWNLITDEVTRDDITQRLMGFAPGTLTGTHDAFRNILQPEDREQAIGLITEAIKNRSEYNSQFRIIWPDGSHHWIQAMGRALYDESSRAYRMLGIVLEVTKRKEDEEALKRAILARDEFLIIASHELKTPITSLKLQLQIAKRGVKLILGIAPQVAQIAKMIDSAMIQVDRLTKLIEDMLDASRIQSGKLSLKFSPVNLAVTIREALDYFTAELAAAKCRVEVDSAKDIVGNWDKARIEQVLVNLLSNAIKYASGTVIRITAVQDGSRATMTIQDGGPGIPKEKQGLIFNRFERATSRNISGLGLGLYICRNIVELHGGTIRVQSEVGKGATFIVELPLVVDSMHIKGGVSIG